VVGHVERGVARVEIVKQRLDGGFAVDGAVASGELPETDRQ